MNQNDEAIVGGGCIASLTSALFLTDTKKLAADSFLIYYETVNADGG